MTKNILDLHRLDELKNFAAKILLKLVCQSRTEICASKGEIVTTEQVQLGIGVRVQLYVGINY